jgi:hypothetical protein
VTRSGRRAVVDAALCGGIFLATFCYRFNSLGGALGGFSNDEFGYLARARQIQAGDVPFRDFNDPGWFLTDYMSAAAQWIGGYNLRSEAVLTIGMLSVGTVVTFLLARRAARSTIAALVAVAIVVALEPRHYNYPKIVLYAVALALAWAYIENPRRVRLTALAAIAGVGFLFRHDHLIYLGALSLMTIAAAHRSSVHDSLRAMLALTAVTAVFVGPFLVFVALNGGIGEYFRTALVYVRRDAQRTSFSWPRFVYDPSRPLMALTRGAENVEVNVRWKPASDDERRARESKYRLTSGTAVEGTTWRYHLQDVSRENIESLVRDPLVEDTHGIDRATFDVARGPLRFESQLDTLANATAFLYYGFLALPLIGATALLRLRSARGPTHALSSTTHLIPLLLLAAALNVAFLSRGSTNIRIPDVGVTSAIILAWLMAVTIGRDVRVVTQRMWVRAGLRTAGLVALLLTVLSVNGLAHTPQTLRDAGFAGGPAAVGRQTQAVWHALGIPPHAWAQNDEQPRLLKVAAYVAACTAPGERVFVLGHYPELYYFADRLFAGGHAWLLPFYYSGGRDEALIVQRLDMARVPIVFTEGRPQYENEYRPVFQQIDAYVARNYREAGEVDAGDSMRLRALVRADRRAVRTYDELGLPCFTAARSDSGR